MLKDITNGNMINAFVKKFVTGIVEESLKEKEDKQALKTEIKNTILVEHIGRLLFKNEKQFTEREEVKTWLYEHAKDIIDNYMNSI